MAEGNYAGWEKGKPLGEGGQSQVFLARSPERVSDLQRCLDSMRATSKSNSWASFAEACSTYARPDLDSELGALKVFKRRGGTSKPVEAGQESKRLHNEIEVLSLGDPGLPKLLASSESEFWVITEYFRQGSLERQMSRYQNKPLEALQAFRSLVVTAKILHDQDIVHRDIKPHNIFVRKDDDLVLGDLGIVFIPDAEQRVTQPLERVGPWEYMPPWADTGERVDDVKPSTDVYMLGKLLWCMVSGKLRLVREDYREPNFDLTNMFPGSPQMEYINLIFDKCLVPREPMCLASATELLSVVNEALDNMKRVGNRFLPNGDLSLVCLMCGKGTYKLRPGHLQLPQLDQQHRTASPALVQVYCCSVCSHYVYFAPGYPNESAKREWKPL